jgi:hypothetical protein
MRYSSGLGRGLCDRLSGGENPSGSAATGVDVRRASDSTALIGGGSRQGDPVDPRHRVAGLAGPGGDGEAARDGERAQRPGRGGRQSGSRRRPRRQGRVVPLGRGEEVALGNNLDLCPLHPTFSHWPSGSGRSLSFAPRSRIRRSGRSRSAARGSLMAGASTGACGAGGSGTWGAVMAWSSLGGRASSESERTTLLTGPSPLRRREPRASQRRGRRQATLLAAASARSHPPFSPPVSPSQGPTRSRSSRRWTR